MCWLIYQQVFYLLKVSADGKKKYGTDTKNIKYKPGGGHVKIFTQKLDTTTVGPRTDSKPRALQSPRGSTPGEFEKLHDKNNNLTCAPSEDSDQPGHPRSLISVFAVRSMGSLGPKPSSGGQRRLIRLGGCPG